MSLIKELKRHNVFKVCVANAVIPEQSFGWRCIEAHRNPSLYPQVREKAAEETARDGFYRPSYLYCMALVGDVDEAFAALDMELEEDPTAVNTIWSPDPPYITMRQSPRFKEVLRDDGLVALYKVRGWPDRCRATGEDDFICD